ncbi:MAG: hypothetical protein BGO14_01685 [Chlamydiales bacterium 38-26]|nr:MAG: hypothetical protein BGO14_01685 [Chlamydiales bacterium 38-26]
MLLFTKEHLLKIHDWDFLLKCIEEGFMAYSKGEVNMPPVCHMHFESPPGDLHVKCAANKSAFYVVKVASCFTENPRFGRPSIYGLQILFHKSSGEPVALFLDEGYLTHLRTALAGAICAKYLAPQNMQAIGILGVGQQARFQLKILKQVTNCREVYAWGPHAQKIEEFQNDPFLDDFKIHRAKSPAELTSKSQLIVTTTPSTTPLLKSEDILPGTHITAVGSDRPGKQELDSSILRKANRLIVDSRAQCFLYGETACALQAGMITPNGVTEIGEILLLQAKGRESDEEITVADLTGLGIQDLMIAEAFYQRLA